MVAISLNKNSLPVHTFEHPSKPHHTTSTHAVTQNVKKIQNLLDQHDDERLNGINLIVSENRMTQTAMAPLGTDIHTRYAASFYAGTVPAQSIIELATESAKRVFAQSMPTSRRFPAACLYLPSYLL